MGTRLRKALSSAVSAAILVALAMFAFAYIDSTVSLGGWVFVAVIGAALAGFLSQYYLWGRHEE